MSTEDNRKIAEKFFSSMGDRERLLSMTTDDVEWIIPGEGWPLAGTHRGHAGLTALLETASETVDTVFPEPLKFVAQDDRIFAEGFATGTIKATNKTFEDRFVFALTLRDGKVAAIREYVDTQALARASEPDTVANR